MGDGSDFNAESGEPRKTLFGVEARFFAACLSKNDYRQEKDSKSSIPQTTFI